MIWKKKSQEVLPADVCRSSLPRDLACAPKSWSVHAVSPNNYGFERNIPLGLEFAGVVILVCLATE